MPAGDGGKRLRSKQREAFARSVALDGLGLSDAYRKHYDCSNMKTSSVNSNAKKLARETPVRLRIAWLKAHGMPEPEGPGRPTDFRPQYCAQATHLCMLGATDADLCEFFGCAESTLNRWKHEHPEFSEALKAGKIVTDMDVAVSLNKRARGFDYEEEQPVKVREVHYQDGKKVSEVEKVELVKVRRIQPPDTAAAIFWLTNRRRDQWKQRATNEHTGKDGGPMEFRSLDVKRMSDEELDALVRREAEAIAAETMNGEAHH